jgi:ecotin
VIRHFFAKERSAPVSYPLMKHLFVLIACCISAFAQPSPLKAFPAAKEGQQRIVIEVPEEANEEALKVELIVGKVVATDGVNRNFFGGNVEEVELKGWGYSYYELKKLGPMGSTLMRVPPGAKPVDAFVRVNHQLPLLRYNSRMPIVVYVPDGVEVKYRVWRAGVEAKANKG